MRVRTRPLCASESSGSSAPFRAGAAGSVVGFALLAIAAVSCVRIPPEATELSTVVGQRVVAIQDSHEAFARAYFAAVRERVTTFFDDRWVPEFLATFVQDARLEVLLLHPEPLPRESVDRLRTELASALRDHPQSVDPVIDAVQRALGDATRGKTVLQFAQAAIAEIDAKRAALVSPIDAIEDDTLRLLRQSYAELLALQNAVTAFLASAQKAAAAEDAVLKRMNLLARRDEMLSKVAALNGDVEQALGAAEKADDVVTKVKAALDAHRPGASKPANP